jgi:hypothetical protein
MQRIRREPFDHPPEPAAREHRQPDIGIGRAGQRVEPVRPDHLDAMAHRPQFLRQGLQRAHHPVHLRQPRVRHDQHARRQRPHLAQQPMPLA